MTKITRFFKSAYVSIVNSLAFFPSLMSLGFLLFSFFIMHIEYLPFIIKFKEGLSGIFVSTVDDARLILGTVTGSIFSLMVFSFSMVMLVLNRASATLSPRVIPGLITKKTHQIVLGLYLGTIIFSLVLIVNIQSETAEYQIPTLGVLISMILAISCLGLFVYFIDSISKAIQVDNILQLIFQNTLKQIHNAGIPEKPSQMPNTDAWLTIPANTTGYLKQIEMDNLAKICKENNITAYVPENLGFFFVKGFPLVKISNDIDDDLKEAICNCFMFYIEEHVSDHYLFGFKQISEIAVKALSPGINDPATGVKSIDMLTILYIAKMHLNEKNYIVEEDKLLLFYRVPSLEELLFANLTPISGYGKTDATVMLKVLESLKNLAYADREKKKFQGVLSKYMQSMISSAATHIKNDLDIEQIDLLIENINHVLGEDYTVKRKVGKVID